MGERQYIRSHDVENRASWRQKWLWRIETVGWDLIYWWPLSLLSPQASSNFGGWLFRRLGPLLSQHKTACRNLRLAFPEWPEARVQAVARDAWESAGRTAGELPHLKSIDPNDPDGPVRVIGGERLDEIEASAKGAVLVSGHFANWEVMAAVICNRPVDCLVTYRALNNPHVDRRLNKVRHDYGIEVLTPKGLGTRELMSALTAGRCVALLNDQKFREGIAVPFFGHEAMTAPGPTRLALKYGVPIIPMSTVRTGPAQFEVTVHPPIHPTDVEDGVRQITAFIEAQVRAHPGQWFWMHRRWPKDAWKA